MSVRSGKGALLLKNPSKAKLREIGRRGNETAHQNRGSKKTYSDVIPF